VLKSTIHHPFSSPIATPVVGAIVAICASVICFVVLTLFQTSHEAASTMLLVAGAITAGIAASIPLHLVAHRLNPQSQAVAQLIPGMVRPFVATACLFLFYFLEKLPVLPSVFCFILVYFLALIAETWTHYKQIQRGGWKN
jgi:hypothetical protein